MHEDISKHTHVIVLSYRLHFVINTFTYEITNSIREYGYNPSLDIEVPSRVDGKRRYLARVSDFVSWDEACRVPRHKITHECKIPPPSIYE